MTDEVSLINSRVPLCKRAARARTALRSRSWALKELTLPEGAEALDRQFVLYVLGKWMSLENILRLSDPIGGALDRLPEANWHRLASSMPRHMATMLFWRHRQERRPQRGIERGDLPHTMSDRLAALLLSRLSSASARAIFDRYLSNYAGSDTAIFRVILDVVMEKSLEDTHAWAAALPAVAHAYSYNVTGPGIFRSRHQHTLRHTADQIPYSAASRICADAGSYPLSLVSQAEAILAGKTGADAIPVGKIAATDGWFDAG